MLRCDCKFELLEVQRQGNNNNKHCPVNCVWSWTTTTCRVCGVFGTEVLAE